MAQLAGAPERVGVPNFWRRYPPAGKLPARVASAVTRQKAVSSATSSNGGAPLREGLPARTDRHEVLPLHPIHGLPPASSIEIFDWLKIQPIEFSLISPSLSRAGCGSLAASLDWWLRVGRRRSNQ